MCYWCRFHGDRDEKWYEKHENYLFNKVFRDPEVQEQKKQEIHQTRKEIAWGSQIRSYVFNPYRMVKDHRTKLEMGDLDRVMDGDIDMFIDAYMRMKK